jgi:transcriptional regulator with GAF, ATPase, and Fis domain
MVHPEDRELVRQIVQHAIVTKENVSVEYRGLPSDGSIRWMRSQGKAYFKPSGDPDHLTGVTIDITVHKESDQALLKAYAEIKQLKEQMEAENIYLRQETGRGFEQIIGDSSSLKKVLQKVTQVAATDSTVLITGETGTGKELIAQAIHNLSNRHNRLMVKVNCAALPAGLIESELFGREKGAYTGALAKQIGRFELADASTLFLDEITDLPLDLQAKLLRVLESGEFERLGSPKTIRVNVRLIAATNRDMAAEVRKGTFREDLYYRLKVFPIEVPPLRERIEDIPLLVQSFVNEFSEKMGKNVTRVSKKTMDALQRYHWPGNIRELRNVIEQAVIINSGGILQVNLPQTPAGASFKGQTLEETEYQHILEVLSKTGWRIKGQKGAAELLGLKPSTLYTKMNKLGIPNQHQARRYNDLKT